MTLRKPLVIVSGAIQELSASDTIAAAATETCYYSTSNGALGNNTNTQALFTGFSALANKDYEVELLICLSHAGTVNAHTTQINFSNVSVSQGSGMLVRSIAGTVDTLTTTVQSMMNDQADTLTTVTASNSSAREVIWAKGIIRIGTSNVTVNPQLKFSTAPNNNTVFLTLGSFVRYKQLN